MNIEVAKFTHRGLGGAEAFGKTAITQTSKNTDRLQRSPGPFVMWHSRTAFWASTSGQGAPNLLNPPGLVRRFLRPHETGSNPHTAWTPAQNNPASRDGTSSLFVVRCIGVKSKSLSNGAVFQELISFQATQYWSKAGVFGLVFLLESSWTTSTLAVLPGPNYMYRFWITLGPRPTASITPVHFQADLPVPLADFFLIVQFDWLFTMSLTSRYQWVLLRPMSSFLAPDWLIP